MNFTFQTKVQIMILVIIAALIVTVQLVVVDKISDVVMEGHNRNLENFQRHVNLEMRYGSVTKVSYMNKISSFIDTVENKKLWIAISKLRLPIDVFYDSHSLLFYDSDLKPLRKFSSDMPYQQGTSWVHYVGSKIEQKDDLVNEIDSNFIRYLVQLENYPVMVNYYSQLPDRNSSREMLSLCIEVSSKDRNISDMKKLFYRFYRGNKWKLIDTTYNLVFSVTGDFPYDKEKTQVKNILFLEKKRVTGDLFLMHWDRRAVDFYNYFEDSLFAQKKPVVERTENYALYNYTYRTYVHRDEQTELTTCKSFPKEKYSGFLYVL